MQPIQQGAVLLYLQSCFPPGVCPKLSVELPDDWSCTYCWAEGIMGGMKDGKERQKAEKACNEMEMIKE